MEPKRSSGERTFLYPLLVLLVVFLALIGYSVYVSYPRFTLPTASGLSLLILAVTAGVASFFSPCSFPLMVTLLAHQPSDPRQPEVPLRRTLVNASALAAGAAVFLLITGLGIAFGLRPILGGITFGSTAGRLIRVFVGILLIALGVIQAKGKTFSFPLLDEALKPIWKAQVHLRKRGTVVGILLYGFVYVLAGLG